MAWFIESSTKPKFVHRNRLYGSTVVMIFHPDFKGTRVTHLLSHQIRRMIMNTSQMITNTNSLMTMGTNSWKIMNNLSHSEEANDQDNLQIDFNPIELFQWGRGGRNVTVELYYCLVISTGAGFISAAFSV